MNRFTVEDCQKLSILSLKDAYNAKLSIEVNQQLIGLTTTKCNYGGERVWFLCPTCHRRIGTLYRKPLSDIFLCRHCLDLTYNLRKYHRASQETILKAIYHARRVENAPAGAHLQTKR